MSLRKVKLKIFYFGRKHICPFFSSMHLQPPTQTFLGFRHAFLPRVTNPQESLRWGLVCICSEPRLTILQLPEGKSVVGGGADSSFKFRTLLILFSMFISFLILYNNHVILTFMTSQDALYSDQIRVVEAVRPRGWCAGLERSRVQVH